MMRLGNERHLDRSRTWQGLKTLLANNCMHLTSLSQVLMTRPRDEWRLDVGARYRTLEQFSKEDARMQFLRILRSLPYGECYH